MLIIKLIFTKAFFKDLPIQLKVGKQGKILHVHPIIYSKTPDSSQNHTRNLLSLYIALKFTALLGDQLCIFMLEGGSFAREISYKLRRRLYPIGGRVVKLTVSVLRLRPLTKGRKSGAYVD